MLDPKFVVDNWPLSGVSFGETFDTYPTRQVIQVHATEGTFVAKIDRQPPLIETAQQTYVIFDYLSARGFSHIPTLLKTHNGKHLFYTQHQSIAIMEYIDGGHPEPNVSTWQELGRIAARLNSFTDYPFSYAIPTQGVIEELTEQAKSHPYKLQFLEFIALLSPLLDYSKQGLIHGEINLANSMRRQNGQLVLIDWDAVGTGATVLETGYLLFNVFLTEDLYFHRQQASAFYRGYYGEKWPSPAEKDLLFRAALLHALRYMRFANQQKRWLRVCYAVAHKASLLAAILPP
jgi:Ser/Thr protein kinase RdoA (MazF antagonist)